MPRSRPAASRGVTLIELMIAVVIVAILASLAYPSYTEHVRKSRRADAKAALLQLAMVMERIYTESNTYRPNNTTPTLGTADTAVFPNKSPIEGNDRFYTLAFQSIAGESFQISATPQGVQAADRCGTLLLSNTGTRSISGATQGLTVDDCW